MAQDRYRPLIKEMPESERPRERLAKEGAGALSNAELLAIALRTGSQRDNALTLAQTLIAQFNGLPGLATASVKQLCVVDGIGPAKAAQILAAVELGKRLIMLKGLEQPQITRPGQAADILMAQMSTLPQEELHVMLLDTKHRLMRTVVVNRGNVNSAMVRAAEVFREPIKDSATCVIVAHNHPSGDPTPSPEDVEITRHLVDAGKLLDIEVIDHLIIGKQDWRSMKEKRLGFG